MKDNQNKLIKLVISRSAIKTFNYSLFQPRVPLYLVHFCLLIITCLLLASCGSTQRPAPVFDRNVIGVPSTKKLDSSDGKEAEYYIVRKGDTLYSIALNHGIDQKELAEWNGIVNPNALNPGQRINLSVPSKEAQPMLYALPQAAAPGNVETETTTYSSSLNSEENFSTSKLKTEPKAFKLPYSEQAAAQLQRSASSYPPLQTIKTAVVANTIPKNIARIEAAPAPVQQESNSTNQNSANIDWMWPTTGDLLAPFSKNSKGIKISGNSGQPVLATAAGKVVYSGNGLRGYGNLIIIKHNNTYLSAYAHNSKLLVKEGETVTKGQKIAEMGNTDTDGVKLHFEIRKHGKPVNPLKFLPGGPG